MAFGDNTVPNITIGNIIRAGQLFDVGHVLAQRQDGDERHELARLARPDPTLQGRKQGEAQLTTSLKTSIRVDPYGPGDIVRTPTDDRLNLQCLLPDPADRSAGVLDRCARGGAVPSPAALRVASRETVGGAD